MTMTTTAAADDDDAAHHESRLGAAQEEDAPEPFLRCLERHLALHAKRAAAQLSSRARGVCCARVACSRHVLTCSAGLICSSR